MKIFFILNYFTMCIQLKLYVIILNGFDLH